MARCAVVDQTGAVINVIVADPGVDSLPSMTLIASDDSNIGVGYVWNGATFELGPELAAQKSAEEAAEQAAIEQEAQEL